MASHTKEIDSLFFHLTENSKLDIHLLKEHMKEAKKYASACQIFEKQVLDVCGERGDLYFLLLTILKPTSKTPPDVISA